MFGFGDAHAHVEKMQELSIAMQEQSKFKIVLNETDPFVRRVSNGINPLEEETLVMSPEDYLLSFVSANKDTLVCPECKQEAQTLANDDFFADILASVDSNTIILLGGTKIEVYDTRGLPFNSGSPFIYLVLGSHATRITTSQEELKKAIESDPSVPWPLDRNYKENPEDYPSKINDYAGLFEMLTCLVEGQNDYGVQFVNGVAGVTIRKGLFSEDLQKDDERFINLKFTTTKNRKIKVTAMINGKKIERTFNNTDVDGIIHFISTYLN